MQRKVGSSAAISDREWSQSRMQTQQFVHGWEAVAHRNDAGWVVGQKPDPRKSVFNLLWGSMRTRLWNHSHGQCLLMLARLGLLVFGTEGELVNWLEGSVWSVEELASTYSSMSSPKMSGCHHLVAAPLCTEQVKDPACT